MTPCLQPRLVQKAAAEGETFYLLRFVLELESRFDNQKKKKGKKKSVSTHSLEAPS